MDVENYRKRLAEAIRGNFPGAEWTDKNGTGVLPCLKNSLPYSVASASNIPGEKSEKFISQTNLNSLCVFRKFRTILYNIAVNLIE